ncbi:MAG: thioredoxin fold domain-containing protein [Fuerstiella sp.]
MIKRASIALLILTSTLTGVAFQSARPDTRSVLMVFRSTTCPPCLKLDTDWERKADFAQAMQQRFRMIPAWNDVRHAQKFREYNVTKVPTFILFDARGREIDRFQGYDNATDLWNRLLLIESRHAQSQEAQEPRPPRINQPDMRSEEWRQLRDAARQLEDDKDTLASQKRELEKQLAAERQRANSIKQSSRSHSQDQIRAIQQASETAEREISSRLDQIRIVEERILKLRSEQTSSETRFDNPSLAERECEDGVCQIPAITPVMPTEESTASSETVNGWKSVYETVSWIAVKAAGPQVSIPLTVGLGALGLLVRRSRNRRSKQRGVSQTGGVGNSTNIDEPRTPSFSKPNRKTENHYLVKETDEYGEAFKEACRRTIASMKSDRPGIVDVVKQIEHTASEIVRGGRITKRRNKAPRPGLWDDEKES